VIISLGLLAISQAMSGDFDAACWSVLWCVLLDKADGTAARLLKATSEFGVQMDSLSDLITFGIAPAAIVLAALVGAKPIISHEPMSYYRYAVHVGAFGYAICAALRLAKFNVMTHALGKEYFFGIPTTHSGALVCTYYLTARKYGWPEACFAALPGVTFALALLMVSRVPLPKLTVRKSLAVNIFQFANVFCVYLFGILRILPEYLLFVAGFYLVVGAAIAMGRGVRQPRPAASATST
jgi:CDP-diacylglycerol--serine O-phosphatidyltransferase